MQQHIAKNFELQIVYSPILLNFFFLHPFQKIKINYFEENCFQKIFNKNMSGGSIPRFWVGFVAHMGFHLQTPDNTSKKTYRFS